MNSDNNMQYKLEEIQRKTTKAGKSYAIVFSGDQKGSMWEGFENLKEGDVVDGDFIPSGDYVNFRLKNAPQRNFGANKGGSMAKVMETKAANIEVAQTRKNDAIVRAGAQRDAVLIVTTFYATEPFMTDAELKEKITEWMKWFAGIQEQPFV